MPNLVEPIRNAVQVAHPGAVVVERGRRFIRHQYAPGKFVLDVSAGDLHYNDAELWQEINTDWTNTAETGYTDQVIAAPFLSYSNANSARKIVPRREVPGEYFVLGRPQYWTGSQWRNLNLPAQIRNGHSLTWDNASLALSIVHTGTQHKFDLILKNNSYATNIRWQVTLTGLTWNNWTLTSNSDGATVCGFRVPTMTDAAGVTRVVAASYSGGYITFTPDYAGLTYPIDIDPTIDVLVTAGGNDVYWDQGGSFFGTGITINSAYWEFKYALRFAVSGLSGSTIDNSYLTVNTSYSQAGDSNFQHIYAEDAESPTAITTAADGNGRTKTTASRNWEIPGGSAGAISTGANSLDAVIQELIDSAYDPTYIQLISEWYDPGAGSNEYRFVSYESSADNCAELHIEYTSGSSPVSITMASATITSSGQAMDVQPGAVTIQAGSATLVSAGQSLDVQPGAVSIALDSAVIASAGQSLDAQPGAVSLSMDSAVLIAEGQIISVGTGTLPVIIGMDAAQLSTSGQAMGVQPGSATVTMGSAVITSSGQALDIQAGAVILSLNSATLTTSAQVISVERGNVLIEPSPISATGTIFDTTVVIGSLSLTPAQILSPFSVFDPSIALSSLSLSPQYANSNATIYDPTVLVSGSVSVSPSSISTLATTRIGLVLGGGTTTPAGGYGGTGLPTLGIYKLRGVRKIK